MHWRVISIYFHVAILVGWEALNLVKPPPTIWWKVGTIPAFSDEVHFADDSQLPIIKHKVSISIFCQINFQENIIL